MTTLCNRSARWRVVAWGMMLAGLATPPLFAQDYLYTINSEPVGYVAEVGVRPAGTSMTTPALQGEVSGWTFAYWKVNGTRQADASGSALPAATFTLSGPTTATAVYIRVNEDTDNDGVPDWYEWNQFGNLDQNAAGDPDSDGFTVGTEAWRGYSPVLADRTIDGGVAARRSAPLLFAASGEYAYVFNSEPGGYVAETGVRTAGTLLTTPALQGEVSGWTFAYWKLNGVPQTDASGASVPAVQFALNGPTTATAVYVRTSDDTDADGIPDWYEWQQFGNLDQSGASDPDGDGLTVAVETWRGYSPRLVDTIADGGVAARRSSALSFIAAGDAAYVYNSEPVGYVSETGVRPIGTTLTTPALQGEVSGWVFAYWKLNGVRQADATGAAVPAVQFTLSGPTTATAVYVRTGDDTDHDGIPDWYEWQQFGNLDPAPTDDPDGDGYTVAVESWRGYSPRLVDTMSDGGIAARRSATLIYLATPTPEPASITTQPVRTIAAAGSAASLSVGISGGDSPVVQWRKLGAPIPGATTTTYTIPSVGMSDAGIYDVVITDGANVVTSNAAAIEVAPPTYGTTFRLDPTFAPLIERQGAGIDGVVVDQSGRSYIIGTFTTLESQRRDGFARLSPTATLDPTFAPVTNGPIGAVLPMGDGSVLVGGGFTEVNGHVRQGFARILSDGATVDPLFRLSLNCSNAIRILPQPDGRFLVMGTFPNYPHGPLVRFDADGTLDPTWSPAGGGLYWTPIIAVQADGKIVAAASYGGVSTTYVVRLNADGNPDPSFAIGTGFNNGVTALAIQPDGRIIAAGWFTSFDGVTCNRLARLNADGTLDPTFAAGDGFGGQDVVNAVLVEPDGRIVLGGTLTSYNGAPCSNLIRLSATGALDSTFAAGNPPNGAVTAIESDPVHGQMVVAGSFTTMGTTPTSGLARLGLDGSLIASAAPGGRVAGWVNATLPVAGGDWIIGGDFTHIDGVTRNRIARLHADGSVDAAFAAGSGFDHPVIALAATGDGRILAAGSFTTFDGTDHHGLARLNADGSNDPSFQIGTGFENPTTVRLIVVMRDGRTVVAGDFTTYKGTAARYITRLLPDGAPDPSFSQWSPDYFNPLGLVVEADGRILSGSWWVGLNNWSISRAGGVRLFPDGSLDNSWDGGGSPINVLPWAFALQPDGKFIVSSYGSSAITNQPGLARFNLDGSFDPNYGTGTERIGVPTALNLLPDGRLLTTGYMSYGGTYRGAGRYLANGTVDATFATFDDLSANPTMYFGGTPARYTDDGRILVPDSSGKRGTTRQYGLEMLRPEAVPPPVIVTQPAAQAVTTGGKATFYVEATGVGPFAYQWFKDGVAISGAIDAQYRIDPAASTDAGTYTVTIANYTGPVTSSAAVLQVTAPPTATFTPVGDLPGGGFNSSIRAATEDGQMAVGSGSVLNNSGLNGASDRPALWTATAGIRELPQPVVVTAGTLFITGSDITPDGSVIAGRVRTSPTANRRAAAIWTNGGSTLTVIPEIAGYTGSRSAADAISSDGTVVYGWSSDTSTGKWQPFRWTAATGTVGLGFLDPSDVQTAPTARGVSADGNVMVGTSTTASGTSTAFIYSVGTGMRSIGYLPGGTWSEALGLTPDGITVFGRGDSSDYPNGQYFTWTQFGGMVPLGVADAANVPGVLGGISADGQLVVCGSYVHNANGFMDVSQVLSAAGLNIAGWSQFSVIGISRHGNVLFGQAVNPAGNPEGWVAVLLPGYLEALALPATIARQPLSQTAIAGSNADFTIAVSGRPGLSAQWYLNGSPLTDGIQADGTIVSGAASIALRLGNLPLARTGGHYTVQVANNLGQVTSPAAVLTVIPPPIVSVVLTGDPSLTQPLALTHDGGSLYVAATNANASDPNRDPTTHRSIFRVPLSGGAATSLYRAANPQQLTVLGGSLNWIDPSSGSGTTQILQAPQAGGGVITAIYNQPGNPVIAHGCGLATDGVSLFATDANEGLVFRLNPDGTGLTQLGGPRYGSGQQPNTIAVSQDTIYIADSGESTGVAAIASIPTTGSSSYTTVFGNETWRLADPAAIAVGDGIIYVSDPWANNTIWALPVSGGNPVALVSGGSFNNLAGLTFANGVLYAADTGNNTIYRIQVGGAQPVVWTNAGGVTAVGNDLVRGGAPAGWTAGAVSTTAIGAGDGYVEFVASETNTYRMCGLSRGDTDQGYADIDYAIYLTASGTVEVYERGVQRGSFGPYATGDVFRVALESGAIKYRKNGMVFYASTVPPTLPLLVDTSFYSPGATLGDAVIFGLLQDAAVAPPVIGLPSGNYETAQDVAVTTTTVGAVIHYTLNGANPIESDPAVTDGTVPVDHGLTLKARAFKSGLVPSSTVTAVYTIGPTEAANTSWTNAVGVTVNGDSLVRGNSPAGWTAGAVSTAGITSIDGYVEFVATETTTYRMCGLSHGDADQGYADIDYAIYLTANGNVEIYEGGTQRGSFGTYAAGDVFRVSIDAGVIDYRRNGAVFYTSTVAPTLPLLVDTSFYSPGATLANVVVFGSLQDAAVAPPMIALPSANYTTAQNVGITTATPGAVIHYTLTGANPLETDPVVTGGAVLVDHGLTLKARAFKSGLVPSSIMTAVYTIGTTETASVTWTNAGGVSAMGNDLVRGSSPAGWTAGAVSTAGIVSIDGYVEFVATETNTYRMCGLSHGDTDQGYADIDYAIHLTAGGTVEVYEDGVLRGAFGSYVTGDVFRVSLDAGAITYRRNGVVFYASTVAPTLPLLVDTSFYNPGATLADVIVSGSLQDAAVAAPAIGLPSGNYPMAQNIPVTTATPGAVIHFTLTGANPLETDPVVSGGSVLVDHGLTLKARAFKSGLVPSSTTTAVYSIGATELADVSWTNASGVTAIGNSIARGNSPASWSAGAVSTKGIVSIDGYVEFVATETNTYRMCGLSHGDTDQGYADIDYAIYLTANGTIEIYEGGVQRGSFGTYAPGDVFRVSLDAGVVSYRKNGTPFHTSSGSPALPLLVDTSLYSPGATLGDVRIFGQLQDAAVAPPEIGAPSGNYPNAQTIAVTTTTVGAVIHYTLNGTNPLESDPVVTGGTVWVDHGLTLEARAFKSGLVPSSTTTAVYTIGATELADVSWTNASGVTAIGNSIVRGNSPASWSAGAVSTKGIVSIDGYVEFVATETNTYRMCGLSHGDTDQGYADIDYAIYLTVNGTVEVYESGAARGSFGTYATGDVFRVSIDAGVINYRKNGAVFHTSTVAPNLPLLVDTSLYSPGATLANVVLFGTPTP